MRRRGRVVPLRARIASAFAFAALAGSAGACSTTAPAENSVPTRTADLAGRITSLVATGNYAGTIRVEADPASATSGAKGVVTLTTATNIWTIERTVGDVRSLATGQWVRVWFTGPVAMIYPVQGAAAAVVVDSLGTALSK